jgi:putative cell wall-binding protein
VSAGVVDGLRNGGLTVSRVAGPDRYATAANIARLPGAAAVGSSGGGKTAVLSSGTNFADALAAGGLVYALHYPQLLTEPNRLPQATISALRDLGIRHVIITGGAAAVSAGVEATIALNGMTTERIAGPTRYATAVAIADAAIDRFGFNAGNLDFATGESFPDALVGGPHAGGRLAPLLLVPKGSDIGPVCDFLRRRASTATVGTILGGRSALESGAKYSIQECTQF